MSETFDLACMNDDFAAPATCATPVQLLKSDGTVMRRITNMLSISTLDLNFQIYVSAIKICINTPSSTLSRPLCTKTLLSLFSFSPLNEPLPYHFSLTYNPYHLPLQSSPSLPALPVWLARFEASKQSFPCGPKYPAHISTIFFPNLYSSRSFQFTVSFSILIFFYFHFFLVLCLLSQYYKIFFRKP